MKSEKREKEERKSILYPFEVGRTRRSRQLPRAADEPASQGFQDPENVSRGSDVQESQNASGLCSERRVVLKRINRRAWNVV